MHVFTKTKNIMLRYIKSYNYRVCVAIAITEEGDQSQHSTVSIKIDLIILEAFVNIAMYKITMR
jgi:hypothetical protein